MIGVFERNEWLSQITTGLVTGALLVWMTLGFTQQLNAQGAGPVNPIWWQDREVVAEDAEIEDFAPANLGQLKWMATQLHKELDLILPLGLSAAGPSHLNLHHDANGNGGHFFPPEEFPSEVISAENHKPANLGQAKNIAKLFYDVLNNINQDWVKDQLIASQADPALFGVNSSYRNPASGNFYPWTYDAADDSNYSPLSVGQLKFIFSTRVRSDNEVEADGLPDLFELALAGLTNAQYSEYIGIPSTEPDIPNPFAGLDISQIGARAGSPYVSYQNENGDWVRTSAKAPFQGLADANASVASLLSQHQPIGSLGGTFSTGGDGSANYSIPIDIPKGTSGMEPSISIGYSSNGGNGALGVGFDLSGFNRITRGGTSRAKEGDKGVDPVDFDENDRFFFDGELLIAVKNEAGTALLASDYGKHGTEYRTENDGFARIYSWGQLGSGPAFWTVETKAGLRIEMGNCDTSCIEDLNGKGALVWNVNKVSDNIGNYYRVVYDSSAPAGFIGYRPSFVEYTGNDRVGTVPYNKVEFHWVERDDVTTGVICGVKVCNDHRLDRIDVYSSGSILHSYQTHYGDYSSETGRSLLRSLQKQYPGTNAAPLQPTVFNWTSHQDPIDYSEDRDPYINYTYQDTLYDEGRQRWHASNNEKFNLPEWRNDDEDVEYTKLIDLNGDGLLDRVSHKSPNSESDGLTLAEYEQQDFGIWVSLNNGRGFDDATRWLNPSISSYYWTFFGENSTKVDVWLKEQLSFPTNKDWAGFYDVNADGLPDRVQFYDFSPKNGFLPSHWGIGFQIPFVRAHNGRFELYNYANGVRDLEWAASRFAPTKGIYVALNTGSGFGPLNQWMDVPDNSGQQSNIEWSDSSGNVFSAFIDMNGDGIPDRVDHKDYDLTGAAQDALWVSIGRGYYDAEAESGFHTKEKWFEQASHVKQNQITWIKDNSTRSLLMDINGDGILDKVDDRNVSRYENALNVAIGLGERSADGFQGSAFKPRQKWLEMPYSYRGQNIPKWKDYSDFIDVNGDGLPDRVDHYDYAGGGGYSIWVRLNKGKYENGSGFHPAEKWLSIPHKDRSNVIWRHDESIRARFMDMNGDGLPDRVQQRDYGEGGGIATGLYVAVNKGYMNSGAGFEPFELWYAEPSNNVIHNYPEWRSSDNLEAGLIDMNGDGRPDRVVARNPANVSEKGFYVALNNKTGFGAFEPWVKPAINSGEQASADQQARPVWKDDGETFATLIDINGDGFLDRLDNRNYESSFSDTDADPNDQNVLDGYGLWVSLNHGKGFLGQGLVDGVVNDDTTNPPTFHTSELIHSITDGLDAEIRVEYKRMNDPSLDDMNRPIYTQDIPTPTEQQNRILNAPGTRWAVARYAEQDGLGGWRWTRNYFGGRKFDNANEVDLGFRWVETYDEARAAGNITLFSQQFPFHGSPLETVSYLADDGNHMVVSRELSSYNVQEYPYISAPEPGIGGQIRFVYNESATSETYVVDTCLSGTAGAYTAVVDKGVGSAAFTGINSILSWRTFTGNFQSKSTVTNTYAAHALGNNEFEFFGDLSSSLSNSPESGVTLAASNIYEDSQIAPPTGYDPATTAFPVSSDHIFGKWILGRLSSAQTTTSRPATTVGRDSVTKSSQFTYYDNTSYLCGMLKTEVAQSGHALALVQEKEYDVWGNQVIEKSYPEGRPSLARWALTTFDEYGRFPISTKNQLGHSSSTQYDPERALVLSSTDANGHTEKYFYDAYGTRILTQHPDGTQSADITVDLTDGNGNATFSLEGATNIAHKRVAQTSGGQPSAVYLDAQGRTVLTESVSFDGRKTYTRTAYDHQGRQTRTSLPYFAGSSPAGWNKVEYDAASRAWCTISPDGSQTKVTHTGLSSTLYNAKTNDINAADTQTQTRELDYEGRLVKTTDDAGGVVTFAYSVDGLLLKTTAPGGHVITNTYNIFGSRLTMTDTDTGLETSTYNAFGDLLTTTDAENNTSTNTYYPDGRPHTVILTRNGVTESTTTYAYDTAPGASLGKIASTNIVWNETGESIHTAPVYDRLGRAIRSNETRTLRAPGSGGLSTQTYSTSTTYDELGRVRSETNAGGLTIFNGYNANGFLETMTDHATGENYWTALTYDASGRLLTEQLGNGVVNTNTYNQTNGTITGINAEKDATTLQDFSYQWDTIGNLKQRKDLRQDLTEDFTYDNLNRLLTATVGSSVHSVTYDSYGNIRTRSDRGTYLYNTGASSHRLGVIAPVINGKPVGELRQYTYNANGFLTSESRAGNVYRTVQYGAHGKISGIIHTPHDSHSVESNDGQEIYGQTAADKLIEFDYGAGTNRIRKVMTR
ncbi:MAG: SpvB/TcaC N-terminal domain-containing protein, partial [Akkermansiaceae bacterium]